MNEISKGCTFLWFIENYNYCWHRCGEELLSPEFAADGLSGTAWNLKLYPRGVHHVAGKISIFLRRNDDGGPDVLKIHWNISILAEKGSSLYTGECTNAFTKECENGWWAIGEMDKIILEQKALYLPKGILTVRCKLWTGEGNVDTTAPICARTRIGIEHISYLHVIEDFSSLETNLKKTVHIRTRSKDRGVISSSLYRSGGSCCEEKIILQITPSDPYYILSKYEVSLVDSSGNIIRCAELDNRFHGNRKEIENFPLSLSVKSIMSNKRDYLPDDKLSLLYEYTFSTGIEFQKIEGNESETTEMTIVQLLNSTHIKEKLSMCPSALEDLKEIYSNKCLTDVELRTKTNSFPAHKMVLCARSPVFKVMMNNDMKEKHSNSIQVDDLEDDIVEKLLIFLYSDDIEDLRWETATKLYYAADKYQIERLKLICSSFLIDNLSTTTVIEILLLADIHSDSDLKKVVEDFILEHDEYVFGSEKWEKLLKANPQLAANTMYLKYKIKK